VSDTGIIVTLSPRDYIHPFDHPDVEASKNVTRGLTAEYERTGASPAEKRMLGQAIEAAKRVNKPSDYPDLSEWFVECGIDSISLNPDTAIKTAFVIARAEARHQRATSTRMGALSGITYGAAS